MRELLEFILKSLVEDKDKIDILEKEKDGITLFQVSVEKDDMGRIIGKGGRIINAIRSILKIKAIKEGKRVNLELLETEH